MPSKKKDITGQRFGRLVILKRIKASENNGKYDYCKCICDCGNEKIVRLGSLRNGSTKSCGCYNRDFHSKVHTAEKHGMYKSRIYVTHRNMNLRCTNPKDKRYEHYGGRGIAVCDEWKDFEVFYEWAMENGYDDTLTIDRIDNDKGYYPENCRWVTRAENNKNRRFGKGE